jgi:hypothetical protein
MLVDKLLISITHHPVLRVHYIPDPKVLAQPHHLHDIIQLPFIQDPRGLGAVVLVHPSRLCPLPGPPQTVNVGMVQEEDWV